MGKLLVSTISANHPQKIGEKVLALINQPPQNHGKKRSRPYRRLTQSPRFPKC